METPVPCDQNRRKHAIDQKLALIRRQAKDDLARLGTLSLRIGMKVANSTAYLQEAAARIDEGVGHLCKDCSEPIPKARLEAVPGAIRCVECQSDIDRRRRDRGVRHISPA